MLENKPRISMENRITVCQVIFCDTQATKCLCLYVKLKKKKIKYRIKKKVD